MNESDDEAIARFEKTGGPAHPAEWSLPSGGTISSPGLTLRDWFAGQALRAIIEADGIQYASNVTAHALFAYDQADAMLAERSKP